MLYTFFFLAAFLPGIRGIFWLKRVELWIICKSEEPCFSWCLGTKWNEKEFFRNLFDKAIHMKGIFFNIKVALIIATPKSSTTLKDCQSEACCEAFDARNWWFFILAISNKLFFFSRSMFFAHTKSKSRKIVCWKQR
jgi:hypothetical protein